MSDGGRQQPAPAPGSPDTPSFGPPAAGPPAAGPPAAGPPAAGPPASPPDPAAATRKRGILIAAVAVAMVVLLACCCMWSMSYFGTSVLRSIRLAFEGTDDSLPRVWGGTRTAHWAGDGRYCVIQGMEPSGTATPYSTEPVVVAWDSESDLSATVPGHTAVGIEPASTRVWMVPDRAKSVGEAVTGAITSGAPALLPDQAGDFFDAPCPGAVVWDITEPVSTVAPPDAWQWEMWPGPGGAGVIAMIDPSKGASPDELRFLATPDTTPTAAAAAARPAGRSRTMEPIGWSPTGRYFAAVSLTPRARTLRMGTTRSARREAQMSDVRAVVYDAASGRAVRECGLGGTMVSLGEVHARVMWDARLDELYCLVEGRSPQTAPQQQPRSTHAATTPPEAPSAGAAEPSAGAPPPAGAAAPPPNRYEQEVWVIRPDAPDFSVSLAPLYGTTRGAQAPPWRHENDSLAFVGTGSDAAWMTAQGDDYEVHLWRLSGETASDEGPWEMIVDGEHVSRSDSVAAYLVSGWALDPASQEVTAVAGGIESPATSIVGFDVKDGRPRGFTGIWTSPREGGGSWQFGPGASEEPGDPGGISCPPGET